MVVSRNAGDAKPIDTPGIFVRVIMVISSSLFYVSIFLVLLLFLDYALLDYRSNPSSLDSFYKSGKEKS